MQYHRQPSQALSCLMLPPKTASEFLSERGFKIAIATLAKLRCIGGGPKFVRFGRYVGYRPNDLLDWAQTRLSDPVNSTSY